MIVNDVKVQHDLPVLPVWLLSQGTELDPHRSSRSRRVDPPVELIERTLEQLRERQVRFPVDGVVNRAGKNRRRRNRESEERTAPDQHRTAWTGGHAPPGEDDDGREHLANDESSTIVEQPRCAGSCQLWGSMQGGRTYSSWSAIVATRNNAPSRPRLRISLHNERAIRSGAEASFRPPARKKGTRSTDNPLAANRIGTGRWKVLCARQRASDGAGPLRSVLELVGKQDRARRSVGHPAQDHDDREHLAHPREVRRAERHLKMLDQANRQTKSRFRAEISAATNRPAERRIRVRLCSRTSQLAVLPHRHDVMR